MFEFETVFFFVSVDCSRLIEKKNEARPRVSPTNPKSDKEPPRSTTSRPPPQPLRNAITLNTLCQRSESVPRSEKQKSTMLGSLALFQSASSSDTPAQKTYHTDGHQHELQNLVGVRKHQYQQQQIYLVSCLLWKRVTTTAEVYAFRSACQCSCHRGTISSLRDRDANNQIHQHTAIS